MTVVEPPVPVPIAAPFSQSRFLSDLETACKALNTPYSEPTTLKVIQTFEQSFTHGAVLFRTTNQPNGPLNYRVYERQSIDMVSLATNAGLLPRDSILGNLVQTWSSLYGDESHQLADFDSSKGLVKFWVFLGGIRPLAEILNVPGVPECIRRYGGMFEMLGLTGVRHTAVDLEKGSMNLYFRTPPDLSRRDMDEYISLAGADPLPDALFEEIHAHFPRAGGTFAVTMDMTTGRISRVAFYALRLEENNLPASALSGRIKTFFEVCPSYETDEMKALAWSFAEGGKRYIKAEHSYTGDLVGLIRGWGTSMSCAE
ncbi:prenyltransferase-like protein [Aspergillus pseudodeflectus]|uniref:Aromatic prenyltransferase n=1 Tax=Aspergillus pseudodeflectus TaxID=176178 RepID=A0ABR4JR09_9EURO